MRSSRPLRERSLAHDERLVAARREARARFWHPGSASTVSRGDHMRIVSTSRAGAALPLFGKR